MTWILPVLAVVMFSVALGLIIRATRTVHRDYVPRAERPRDLGTVVVAKVLPDGTETPRTVAAALLASRPARAELTRGDTE
jgi:ribosomal protein L18E